MNKPETMWNEDALRERMQRAFATASAEAPAAMGRRALEAAKRNVKQRSSGRRFGVASTLLSGAAVALLTWRSHVPLKPKPIDERRHAPLPSVPADTQSRNEASVKSIESSTTPSSAKRIARATARRRIPAPTVKPTIADSERVARLQLTQAEDFQSAARLLEQAGQVEPAYQLYSMSIEAAPTLDATLGAARVLKKMDEATVNRDQESPTSSSLRFEGTTRAG